jgi:ferredoxin
MVQIKVIKENCPANHHCPAVSVCPVGALTQDGFDAPKIDEAKCTKCGKCTRVCPTGALFLVKGS